MKAKLDKLSKKSVEKDAQINHQKELIAELVKKLEKKSFEASNKGLGAENSDKEFNHSENLIMSARQRRITLWAQCLLSRFKT